MPSIEEWRPVVGWEGLYEVSDQGRVRSLPRVVQFGTQTRQVHSRILKPGRTIRGVLIVGLCNGKQVMRSVHQLVLEAFVGPCPPGLEGCHWNDVKTDNRLQNLRWDTHTANMRDLMRNGGNHHARKTHCKQGHEYTPANTKAGANGGRFCRECHRIDGRNRYKRQQQAKRAVNA